MPWSGNHAGTRRLLRCPYKTSRRAQTPTKSAGKGKIRVGTNAFCRPGRREAPCPGAVGSLLVSLTSGWTATVHRHGRAIVVAAAMWGLGIGLVGFTTSLWVVLLLLMLAGAADLVSGIFRTVMWNQTIPDDVRGRMAGIELLSYSVGPLLGQVRSSASASLTSLRVSFISGGALCIIGVALSAIALPSLWNYDDRTSEDAIRERERRRERDA